MDGSESSSESSSNGILDGIQVNPRRRLIERVMFSQTVQLSREEKDFGRAIIPTSEPMVQYQQRPLDFFIDILGVPAISIKWTLSKEYGIHDWDGTPDPLMKVLEALVSGQNCGVESATTTGKTFLGACIVLWFLACFPNALVITVAPKEEQIRFHIWKEIGKLWPRFHAWFPGAHKNQLQIQMVKGSDAWTAIGFVAGVSALETNASATRAQGFHAEHMLIIFEETPGINPAVLTAFRNTCRAPHNLRLAFGNPDHILDPLHLFCQGPRTVHIIISAYDHPNVVTKNPGLIPGAVSEQGISDELAHAANDGGADNRMFKSRVRGISPSQAKNALIQLDWIVRAQQRFQDQETKRLLLAVGGGKKALGVDVANSDNGDQGAIARGEGAVLLEVEAKPCPDSNALGFAVHLEMDEKGILPENVGVDPVGVGAGCVNELHKRDKYVVTLGGNDAPWGAVHGDVVDVADWQNLRSQGYWTLREDLRQDMLALPFDPELVTDLITPTWEAPGNVIKVESKKEIKKRLSGRSTNKGDAVVYWNMVRDRDTVTSKMPEPKKVGQTLRQRVLADVQSLDSKPKAKNSFHVLRQ